MAVFLRKMRLTEACRPTHTAREWHSQGSNAVPGKSLSEWTACVLFSLY